MSIAPPFVVVVDDEVGVKTYYAELLQDQRFKVEVFTSTDKFLSELDRLPKPDLVIADVTRLQRCGEFAKTIERSGCGLVWAARFAEWHEDTLPYPGRVLNKPFKPLDLSYAIRFELIKVGKEAPR